MVQYQFHLSSETYLSIDENKLNHKCAENDEFNKVVSDSSVTYRYRSDYRPEFVQAAQIRSMPSFSIASSIVIVKW